MFDIKENLKNLPDCPGVYMHKDRLGQVIYVGKAISLKKRVRQYFGSYGRGTAKLRSMVSQIAEFEYITCENEMEALVLECNLIKHYMPKYNVLLRDDKTYPYIKVTTNEDFPRVLKTRIIKKDGAKYFGPFTDASAVNDIIDLLNSLFSLRRCNVLGTSPCLNFHINECDGVCVGKISKEDYQKKIDSVLDFLSGNVKPLIADLELQMNEAAERMEFEKAAHLRNQIAAINVIAEKQRATMTRDTDLDILTTVFTEENASVALFPMRGGKVQGREMFPMSGVRAAGDAPGAAAEQAAPSEQAAPCDEATPAKVIIGEFIKQYYSQFANAPKEILVETEPEQVELLEAFLSKEDRKVRIYVPQKGDKRKLLEMAKRDSIELAKTLDDKIVAKREKASQVKEAFDIIRSSLGWDILDREYRVESYDISNTNGVDSVGAMVVFEGLKPVKKAYRRFKIKTIVGPDDYGSLREMLTRRFSRALAGDEGFKTLPDMILMDGGLGQVSSAEKALADAVAAAESARAAATLKNVLVLGMAKDDKHRTRALVSSSGLEISLKDYPLIYSFFGTVQEEVHRFAISYHHSLHQKNQVKSILDSIDGIGPVKRNALLAHFGSVEKIKEASIEELQNAPGITAKNAEAIIAFFSEQRG